MKLIRTIPALLLACVLIGGLFAGCASNGSGDSYYTDESGKPVPLENIVTVNGEQVPLTEFRYYYLSRKDNYQQQLGGDANVWENNQELLESIKSASLDDVVFDRVMRQFAANHEIVLTEEDKQGVQTQIDDAVKQQGSEAKYAEALSSMYLTPDLYRYLLESQALQTKLQTEIQAVDGKFAVPDADAKKVFDDTYLRAKHILVSTDGITDEAELKAKTETAEKALARAQAGEDFDALVEEYGEDPGMQGNPGGYYFVEGDMVAEFYEGTKALEPNAISGLIKSDYGYHIIKRLPLEESYFTSNEATIRGRAAAAAVNLEIGELMEAAVVEKAPEYEKINASNLK